MHITGRAPANGMSLVSRCPHPLKPFQPIHRHRTAVHLAPEQGVLLLINALLNCADEFETLVSAFQLLHSVSICFTTPVHHAMYKISSKKCCNSQNVAAPTTHQTILDLTADQMNCSAVKELCSATECNCNALLNCSASCC